MEKKNRQEIGSSAYKVYDICTNAIITIYYQEVTISLVDGELMQDYPY
jgi:hypothetical protein